MSSLPHRAEIRGRWWLLLVACVASLLVVCARPGLNRATASLSADHQPAAVVAGVATSRPPVLTSSAQSPKGLRASGQNRGKRLTAQLTALRAERWNPLPLSVRRS